MALKEVKAVLILAILFLGLGLGYYFYFPAKFVASGSIFVVRQAQGSPSGDYSYDGYYAQQTARGYTETLIGIIESYDIKKAALEALEQDVSDKNLKKIGKDLSVKKPAPQVVLVEVEKYSLDEAQKTWDAVVSETLKASDALNSTSDPALDAKVSSASPVVREVYKDLPITIAVAVLMGVFVGISVPILKKYVQTSH